ncbi:MAG: hypothetical protein R2825_02410 [Saprospiraceae bacterium]
MAAQTRPWLSCPQAALVDDVEETVEKPFELTILTLLAISIFGCE